MVHVACFEEDALCTVALYHASAFGYVIKRLVASLARDKELTGDCH